MVRAAFEEEWPGRAGLMSGLAWEGAWGSRSRRWLPVSVLKKHLADDWQSMLRYVSEHFALSMFLVTG